MKTVGDRIRERRAALGLSMRDVASRGVSASYVSRIETGDRQPSAKALAALAPKLGVSIYWLQTGKQDPADELARIVLEQRGRPLPRRASTLARAVLDIPR